MAERIEPKIPFNYRNQLLMDELNEMMIRIKTHLYESNNEPLKYYYPKPSSSEIDVLQNKLMEVLKKDKETLIKY